MRIPPERTREYLRAKCWAFWCRHAILRRRLPVELRPFLIVGPPRSGTSLLSSLLDAKPNVITLNEPRQITGHRMFDADPCTLVRGTIHWAVLQGIKRGSVLNKADPKKPGRVTTDTWNRGGAWCHVPVKLNPELPVATGAKATLPLITFLDELIDDWPALHIIIIARNPLYTVNSWRNTFGWQPGFDDPKAGVYFPLYDRVPKGLPPIESRAHIWRLVMEECLAQAKQRPDRVMFVRYESLLAEPAHTVAQLAAHIGCPDPHATIDVSHVKPQMRPHYDRLSLEDIETITRICAPVVARLDREYPVNGEKDTSNRTGDDERPTITASRSEHRSKMRGSRASFDHR